jgi:hypothetical protein
MEIKKFTRQELQELLLPENLLPFNRDITGAHVGKMVRSVEACGLLRAPIIGRLNYVDPPIHAIIDGQHLTTAIVSMKHMHEYDSIECIVKDFDSKRDVINAVARVNNTQKIWNDEHYLRAWHLYGEDNGKYYGNYQFLMNLFTNDNLPCSFVVALYCYSKEEFKAGELTFRDKDFCDKVYKLALMLKNQYDKQSPCLYGLEMWAKRRHFHDKKKINFEKLESRVKAGIRTKERGAMAVGRDDFGSWIDEVYNRL